MARIPKRNKHGTILALDRHYMPMVELSRRKALRAIATGRAHGLDLRTWTHLGLSELTSRPFLAIVFPSTRAQGEPRLNPGRGAAGILRRDGYRCQYDDCTRRATTLDHVIPRCQGGQTAWNNLVACCQPCNARKGGRTPEQAGMTLKRPVRSPRAILLDKLHMLVAG